MYGPSSSSHHRYPGPGVALGGSDRGRNDPYSQIQAFIERACSPMLPEPNMALNLEVADMVNSKKANAPREAAVEVLKSINSRNTHQSMLGLHLLDVLVKNCGYPMHLQVATKDFLNELVRRFPERPPAFPPPPMNKILELIHEWKNTICTHGKHKEDLTNIRDMHRLLGYKGYRFRDFDKRAAQVMNPQDNLKTPDELEEEDRAAQAAKLQELIRRGTPKDLAAAQELMKIMSGAEPAKRPDYASQTAKELAAIQHRILMLNEMLDNVKPNEKFAEGDAFDQIAQRCRNVQPKIQKWIGSAEEGEEADSIDKLLLMNDLINNVLDRYESFKKGDRSVTAEIDPAFQQKKGPKGSSRAAAKAPAAAAPNLIDFDFDEPAPASSSSATSPSNPMDDFAGLSLGGGSSSTLPSNNNGNDLLAGLSFPSSSGPSTSTSTQSQSQQPFYQQYQTPLPPQLSANQQQSMSWGNLTPNNAAKSPSVSQWQAQSSPALTPASPGSRQQQGAASQNALRPSTPGAITLGMMGGSGPSTPSSGQGQAGTQQPSYGSSGTYNFGGMGQSSQPQQKQAGKPKDPFDDLFM